MALGLSILLAPLCANSPVALASTKTSVPRLEYGHVQRPGQYSNPAKFGSLITTAQLVEARPIIRSLKGHYGYALAVIDGDEYPIRTVNGGRSWRVAGTWFATDSADAAAAASSITMFSPLVAAAYAGGNFVYLTTDGGVQWFTASLWGTTMKVTQGFRDLGGTRFFVATVWPYSATSNAHDVKYMTNDDGRRWTLL